MSKTFKHDSSSDRNNIPKTNDKSVKYPSRNGRTIYTDERSDHKVIYTVI